jgi:hypothetical protein
LVQNINLFVCTWICGELDLSVSQLLVKCCTRKETFEEEENVIFCDILVDKFNLRECFPSVGNHLHQDMDDNQLVQSNI